MDIKELLDVVRAEERERCLSSLIECLPNSVCKTSLMPNGETEMVWLMPALRDALAPKRRIALPRHVITTGDA